MRTKLWSGLVPVAGGLFWLTGPAGAGALALALALVPGGLMLTGGLAHLLLPDDLRPARWIALGSMAGVVGGAAGLLWLEPLQAGLALLVSAAAFPLAGQLALRSEPCSPDVPAPGRGLGMRVAVALDEALLALQFVVEPPLGAREREESASEVRAAHELFAERGWIDAPAGFHEAPTAKLEATVSERRLRGVAHEHVRFPSGFVPHPDAPGRDRWLSYEANKIAHARVLRHADPQRPWLVCVHGSRGGTASDLRLFGRLREALGVTVVLPVLPLHGPRSTGRASGAGFVNRYELDFVHAMAQSVWDLRRVVSWAREGGAHRIGVWGVSLGAYASALLAGLESGVDAVVCGVPAVDMAHLDRRAATQLRLLAAGEGQPSWDLVADVYRVVSPLALPPRLPRERLALFAASADRFVPPAQARSLWLHWDRPRIEWIASGHLTAPFSARVRGLLGEVVERGLARSG